MTTVQTKESTVTCAFCGAVEPLGRFATPDDAAAYAAAIEAGRAIMCAACSADD